MQRLLLLILSIIVQNGALAQVVKADNNILGAFLQSENARVVGLGECSHADGTTFSQKVEAIKYLHEHHGYDVVMFESPMLGMEIVNREIATDSLALLKGIFGVW